VASAPDSAAHLGESWDRLVRALTQNGLDESDKELLGQVGKQLLEGKAERDRLCAQLAQLQVELEQTRLAVAELTAQNAKLKKERKSLEAERDAYLRSLHALLPKPDVTFTEEELANLREKGVTSAQLLEEFETAKGS
jgi:hypothetical protein